jgi:hypothetical protein
VVYMEQLKKAFRDAGIVVPFMHNEKGMRSVSWSTDYNNVGGAVNIYGLDSYPGGFSCTEPNKGFNLVRNYHQWFSNYSYTQPSFLPEFRAGWFEPWGGTFYDQCASEHDPAFADVYYKNNIGQRVTMLSLYMAYGGTNPGHSAAPVVSKLLVLRALVVNNDRCIRPTTIQHRSEKRGKSRTSSNKRSY